jgi:hypothetical protein
MRGTPLPYKVRSLGYPEVWMRGTPLPYKVRSLGYPERGKRGTTQWTYPYPPP